MKPSTDERLDGLLGRLPRAGAPDDFSSAVLSRVTARRRRHARWQRAAVVTLVLGLGLGTWLGHERRVHEGAARETQALRHELQVLSRELDRLERLRPDDRPVVFLGATSDVDIVVDLQRMARQGQIRRARGLRPAGLGVSRPARVPSSTIPTSGGIYP